MMTLRLKLESSKGTILLKNEQWQGGNWIQVPAVKKKNLKRNHKPSQNPNQINHLRKAKVYKEDNRLNPRKAHKVMIVTINSRWNKQRRIEIRGGGARVCPDHQAIIMSIGDTKQKYNMRKVQIELKT